MSRLVLTVPMPPNIGNGSHGNWYARAGEKKGYHQWLCNLLAVRQLPPLPAEPFTKATISSVMYLGAAMDDDNAMRRHKWVLDWLKGRYIADDRKKVLKWAGFPEQVVKRGQDYRIVLTLESAA